MDSPTPAELDLLRRRFEHYAVTPDRSKRPAGVACVIWPGSIAPTGYGQLEVSVDGQRRHWLAHRAAWVLNGRPLPENLHHLCEVKPCVRLDHLEPLTIADHAIHHNSSVTECVNGHRFTEANTYRRPDNGNRQCRACKAQRERERYARMHG